VKIPASGIKKRILDVLAKEGYIKEYEYLDDGKQGLFRISLAYTPKGESIITEIIRVSKPSRRIYVNKKRLPQLKKGIGITILSTSQGVMTDREAGKRGIGGEVLCYVR
jgi:small subunit ribosomal protein S8